MSDLDSLKSVAKAVKQWSNCNKAWLDTSEDDSCAVVGHIDEDGNCYAVATIDCDQYYAGQDSLQLAKFYANANPAIILELIERLEFSDKQRDELLATLKALTDATGQWTSKSEKLRVAHFKARVAYASVKFNAP